MTTVGERISYLLEERDMKQTVLAEKVGISKQSLYKYLHCKCEPRAEIIAKIAEALGTSADFIVGLTSNSKPRAFNQQDEKSYYEANSILSMYYKLTDENKLKVNERIETLLDLQK